MHRLSHALSGHLWTIAPTLRHRFRPRVAPAAEDWSTVLEDEVVGAVRLNGRYRAHPGADTLVILLHGLGGHAESAYLVDAAIAVERAGRSCLRLCLRGSAGSGEDIYHSGLTADVHAALKHPKFAAYKNIWMMGFSLGGHVALKVATEDFCDPRVRAVAAVCPPLDLGAVQAWLDAPARKVYREYILRELRTIYAQVDARGRAPTPSKEVRRARTLRDWDSMTVVPRFGFRDAQDYYDSMSVGTRLQELRIPSLLIASQNDPMIPGRQIPALMADLPANLEIYHLNQGGHVFFPPTLDIGLGQDTGVAAQALDWLGVRAVL